MQVPGRLGPKNNNKPWPRRDRRDRRGREAKRPGWFAQTAWLLLPALLMLMAFPESPALAEVLERIAVDTVSGAQQVRIEFNQPLRYVAHRPQGPAEQLEIQMVPLLGRAADLENAPLEETLNWSPTPDLPLIGVSYEQIAPQSANLTVAFARRVVTQVKSSRDLRSLLVTLQPAGPRGADLAGSTGEPAAFNGPVPSVDDVLVRGEADGGEAAQVRGTFVIVLTATADRRLDVEIPDLEVLRRRELYKSEIWEDSLLTLSLRLGFFSDRSAAEEAAKQLRPHFPKARVVAVSAMEREVAAAWRVSVSIRRLEATMSQPTIPADKPAELLTEAKGELTAGNLPRAIRLLTKLSRYPDSESARDGKELLGLARQRNRQSAQARSEYEEYLARYPEGEGSDRVKQRLAALLTATATPQAPLRAASGRTYEAQVAQVMDFFFGGSVGQTYIFEQSFRDLEEDGQEDEEEALIAQNGVESDFDFSGGVRTNRYEASFRVGGAVGSELIDGIQDLALGGELALTTMIAEFQDSQAGINVQLGRQRGSSGGVLGRFDGASFSIDLMEDLRLNLVGGLPVRSARDLELNEDQYFAGISLDLGTFWDAWDFNVFFINQVTEGLTDRRAVGGEVRYFGPQAAAFMLVDYDIFFRHLNTALLNTNYSFENGSTISLGVDYRSSPILTLETALQGQGVDTLDQLRQLFNEDDLAGLARDRAAASYTLALGGTLPLTERFSLAGDVTLTSLTGTEESGGVEATEGTGLEGFYSLQLIGNSLLMDGDLGILGLRYADTANSQRYAVDVSARYPLAAGFRISPRMRVEYRDNADDDGQEVSIRPSARLNYRLTQSTGLEVEIGGDLREQQFADGSERELGYFVLFGYRSDF